MYARSSSLGAWELCQHKYFLNYVLGIKEGTNDSANIGNAVHKALELRARAKLADQQGLLQFREPENDVTLTVDQGYDEEEALEYGWNVYYPNLPTTDEKYDKCKALFESVIEGKLYDPKNLTIVEPEQYFDMEIEEDWAKFEFTDPHTKEVTIGNLRIRGTVDLLTEDNGVLHYIDWKTGRKWDWAKGKKKTYEDLMADTQLMLYHYALRKLYPDRDVMMTIYFVKEDGPTTLAYSDHHIEELTSYLRETISDIWTCEVPNRRVDSRHMSFASQPCSFCGYGKMRKEGKRVCDYYHQELLALGMERCIEQHGRPGVASSYSGGGRTEVKVGD